MPTFATEDEAIDGLCQFVTHCELMAGPTPAAAGDWPRPAEGPSGFLDEPEALSMLDTHGITTVRRQICRTVHEALAFLSTAPGPIVMKAVSPQLPHKSEHGLVRLSLAGEHEIRVAFDEILVRVTGELGLDFRGVLAAEMVRGGRELAVGGRIDPVFGPVIMLGDGGTLVEAMPDNALLLPPFDDIEVGRVVKSLRIAPLFNGVRGKKPLALSSVAAAARAVHAALIAGKGRIRAVEINPLIVSDSDAVAVDALIETDSMSSPARDRRSVGQHHRW